MIGVATAQARTCLQALDTPPGAGGAPQSLDTSPGARGAPQALGTSPGEAYSPGPGQAPRLRTCSPGPRHAPRLWTCPPGPGHAPQTGWTCSPGPGHTPGLQHWRPEDNGTEVDVSWAVDVVTPFCREAALLYFCLGPMDIGRARSRAWWGPCLDAQTALTPFPSPPGFGAPAGRERLAPACTLLGVRVANGCPCVQQAGMDTGPPMAWPHIAPPLGSFVGVCSVETVQ